MPYLETAGGGVVIRAEGVVKVYQGRTVVDQVSFAVRRGECFGILGPNGAGKSTLLRITVGLTPADGGVMRLLGEAMHPNHRALKRRVGVVPQDDNLDMDLTVRENLLVFGDYFGLSRERIRQRIPELLTFAQLADRAGASVRSLSGGMRRRLLLARALLADPDILVLDEPTTGLDPQARHLLWQRMRSLRERGATLLLTTHYMDEAEKLCDRILVLDHGRILALDEPAALIRQYVEPEVVEAWGEVGNGDLPARMAAEILAGCRVEAVGDGWYFHTRDPLPLMAALDRIPGLSCLRRPANLEDVFLRLTGRELRD